MVIRHQCGADRIPVTAHINSIAAQFLPVPVVVLLGFAGALGIVVFAKNSTERSRDFHPSIRSLCMTYLLLLISILSLAGVSGFLYTNF